MSTFLPSLLPAHTVCLLWGIEACILPDRQSTTDYIQTLGGCLLVCLRLGLNNPGQPQTCYVTQAHHTLASAF